MTEKKKSRISPIFKRAVSHIFTKPATTKYPFVKPNFLKMTAAKQSIRLNLATSSTLEQAQAV